MLWWWGLAPGEGWKALNNRPQRPPSLITLSPLTPSSPLDLLLIRFSKLTSQAQGSLLSKTLNLNMNTPAPLNGSQERAARGDAPHSQLPARAHHPMDVTHG